LYPREITLVEKKCLFMILPENKPGYNLYRNKIEKMMVLGEGSSGSGSYILGEIEPEPDLLFPSAPVFALGIFYSGTGEFDLLIHEETENKIEVWFSKDLNENFDESYNLKSYSSWIPGDRSPFSDSKVREIVIRPKEFMLAVAPEEKKIWLYESSSGVNHLIPLSNYYNSLMLIRNERNAEKALNPNLFFNNLGIYNDQELKKAFEQYNKYMRRKLL
jgi:hypothetical protein